MDSRQKPMLKKAYAKNISISPFLIILRLSHENVENVVYPPQNPTIKRYIYVLLPDTLLKLHNSPINKEPVILTVKVANGNEPFAYWVNKQDIKKRKTLPVPPPIKIKNNVLNIFQHSNSPFFILKNSF